MNLLRRAVMVALGGGGGNIADLFSVDVTTAQSEKITNGVNALDNKSLLWLKSRTSAIQHYLVDTVRGKDKYISSNSANAEGSLTSLLTSFDADGYTTGASVNPNYVGWQFRQGIKFMDVVTYTGNNIAGTVIPHALEGQAGFLITKRLAGATANWACQHIATGGEKYFFLNTTGALGDGPTWNDTPMDDVGFTLGTGTWGANVAGADYVAYVFAHDPSPEGLIQCGEYIGTGVSGNKVTLGWRPQFLMIKRVVGGTGSWLMLDTRRGIAVGSADARLYAEDSAVENNGTNWVELDEDGFRLIPTFGNINANGDTYIYMAIREE